jgi:DNA-binding CsgD family transcriptional regulator
VTAVDLVGRTDEILAIDQVLELARDGTSGVLVLRGSAGIGKTALLDYAFGRPGLVVTRVAGIESEMELGFGALHQVLRPFLSATADLPVRQREALEAAFGISDGPIPDRFLIGLATLTLLTESASEMPLLCVVDDAQWVDEESLVVLAFVARRLAVDGIAMLFAVRTPDEPAMLVDLPSLDLEGIPAKDAIELLRRGGGSRVDDGVGQRLLRETGSNPLALLELADELSPAQLSGESTLPEPLPIGRRLQDVFLARVRALPDSAQMMLLIAAADSSGDASVLLRAASALGIEADDTTLAVAERLLVIGTGVQFRHPLIRSAVYQGAQPEERRRVHLALATATEGEPDRRVWHLAAAAPGPDEDVAQALEQSAMRVAIRGGYGTASRLMTRAVELTDDEDRRAGRLLLAAGAALVAGNPTVAQATLESAAPRLESPLERAEGLRLRGVIRFAQGEPGEPVVILMEAARAFEDLDARRTRDTLFEAFEVATWTSREATLEVARAARASRALPPGPPTTLDLLLDAFVTRMLDGYTTAAPMLRAAVDAVIADEEELRGFNLASIAASELFDLERSRKVTERWVNVSRAKGALGILPLAIVLLMATDFLCGKYALATALSVEALELSKVTTGILGVAGHGAELMLAFTGPEADARAAAAAHIEEGLARGQGTHGALVPRIALSFLELGLGNYEAAREVAAEIFEPDFLGPVSAWGLADYVEAAARSGRRDEAEIALARLTEHAVASETSTGLGHLARSRALLASDSDAEPFYREAIAHLDASPAGPDRARAHLVYGEWLVTAGRSDDARATLRTALAMFESMGAEFFAQRAAAALAATGDHVRRHRGDGDVGLTSQELQVAQFAADGATNREIAAELFISSSTVDYHLRKVFRKLGITARTQLPKAMVATRA